MSDPAPHDALPELLISAGLLTATEADVLPPTAFAAMLRDPYRLTTPIDRLLPAPALRWGWQRSEAEGFCRWVRCVLQSRFGVTLEIAPELGPDGAPILLRLRLGENEAVCDWAYLNEARWMGAFGTIAGRLLRPRGIEALELETGDLDTVLLFCWSATSERLRTWLPVAV